MNDLDFFRRAVGAGIISSDQAVRLAAFAGVAKQTAGGPFRVAVSIATSNSTEPPTQDDEQLRLIGGFGDIFVSIGILLFLGASGWFLAQTSLLVLSAGMAVFAWLLAEYFTRVRRMALPSIVLFLVYGVAIFVVAGLALGGAETVNMPIWRRGWLQIFGLDPNKVQLLALASAITLVGCAAHYWRFAVPITIAACASALIGFVLFALTIFAPGFVANFPTAIFLAIGIATFALAMWFDFSDRERQTRATDVAFWLHLLAAPLIVHPLLTGVFAARGALAAGSAVAIFGVFVLLGFVAVLIDRRAILVSGLGYAGFALAALMREFGIGGNYLAPGTMLALGGFILLLSAGWQPLRAIILRVIPAELALLLPVGRIATDR